TVSATDANGLTGSATVRVSFSSPEQAELAVTGVQPASGATGVETDEIVAVSFNKAIAAGDLSSSFTASANGAPLAGSYSVAPGGQMAMFMASSALPVGQRVLVRVSGVQAAVGPGMSSGFASDFTVRPALTLVRGTVLDEQLHPLGNVRVSLV